VNKKVFDLFTAKEKRNLIFTLFAMLILGVLEVAGIASILPFMAVVSNPESIEENNILFSIYTYFNFNNSSSFLLVLGIVVFVLIVFSNAFSAWMNWWTTYFVSLQSHRISTLLLEQYLSKSYTFFLNRNSSDLSKNIINEVNRCVGGIFLPALQIMAKIIVTVLVVSLLILVDPLAAIVVMLTLGLSYLLIYKLVRNRLHLIGVLTSDTNLARYKIANEAISGVKDLKLMGREQEFVRRFSIPSKDYAEYLSNSNAISSLPRYLLEAIAFGGIILLVLFMIKNGGKSGEVIPVVSLYALAGYRLLPALQQIYAGLTKIRYNLPALNILLDDFLGDSAAVKRAVMPSKRSKTLPFEKHLKLENIEFSYPNTKNPVIENLDMTIIPCTTIGFVGSTGSGKTTLVDILLGLLQPDNGDIFIDDIKITSKNISIYQKNIGYVPQAIYLLDDTIERNIAFAVPDDSIDNDRVIKSAQLAELDTFVKSLPDGYQTVVGERGVRLSGGQRQRIGIARALYDEPKILVLDEATSALDGKTENVIMDALHNLSHDKTIIMIAHRLSTLKECDTIYILKNGNIIDSGKYKELISNNNQFKEMANL